MGSQGPLPLGVVRSVSLSDAHGSYAQEIRRKLDQTKDVELLSSVGRELISWGVDLYRRKAIDFDPYPLGKQYIERALSLEPESRLANFHRLMLHRMESHARWTALSQKGQKQEQILATASETDRWFLLPMAIEYAYRRGDLKAAESHARDHIALAKSHKEHPMYAQAVFDANMYLGKIAMRQRDRRNAGKYLLAAMDSARLPGTPIEMTLARSLVDWGECDLVAQFLDRCAALSSRGDQYKTWASDIRKGINPDLIPYTTGCSQEPC